MESAATAIPERGVRRPWTLLGLAALAVAVGTSWLLVVFLLDGRNLLDEMKLKVQTAKTARLQTVTGVLARSASLSAHVGVVAIYATPAFFTVVQQRESDVPFSPERSLIFIVNEDTHHDELSYGPTPATLRIDGKHVYHPEKAETLTYSIHHKVSVLSFPKGDAQRGPMIHSGTQSLELLVPKDGSSEPAVLRWELPIVYPNEALQERMMPVSMMVAFATGLLATVVTPCLIQLVLYYLSTLTGLSSERISRGALIAGDRWRVLKVALAFVSGFTTLFTGVGALAGLAGQKLQHSDVWAVWTRPSAVAAGIIIMLLGLWMAARARAPLVCRLPLAGVAETCDGGVMRSMLMGFSFAVGCATCFGGALIATLLLYVGTLGSAAEGALILFLFSLGVDIPFLAAALVLVRVLPRVTHLDRTARVLGVASSAVTIGFGLLLITDNFHRVSAWIYRWVLS